MKKMILTLLVLFSVLTVDGADPQYSNILRFHGTSAIDHYRVVHINGLKLYGKTINAYNCEIDFVGATGMTGSSFRNSRIKYLHHEMNINDEEGFDCSNCDFSGAVIEAGDACLDSVRECSFMDTELGEELDIALQGRDLAQTKNFKSKHLKLKRLWTCADGIDFSDFVIEKGSYLFLKAAGAKLENTLFQNCRIIATFSSDQLKSTANYKKGYFHGLHLVAYGDETCVTFCDTDFSKMTFSDCSFGGHSIYEYTKFSWKGTILEDTVFANCDLSNSTDLTLEQVKSTWNYKAGRMSLCKWPEYIEKALEEEEKAKAQEEKK